MEAFLLSMGNSEACEEQGHPSVYVDCALLIAQRVTHFKHWRIPSLQERDSLALVPANSVSAAMMKTFLVDGCVGHLTPRLVQTCSTKRHPPPHQTHHSPFLWERAISDKVPMCVGSVVVAVILGGVNKEQFPATPRGFQQEICRWISTGIQGLNSKFSSRSSEKICQVES